MIQENPGFDRHHEVRFHQDSRSGLRAIVAIHRAWDGPSVGGCRLCDYASEEEALSDVLRLSRSMTFKSVMAGFAYGGAKAVIIGTPTPGKREAVLLAMADLVERMNGRFRTGVDVGLTPQDVAFMSERTRFMVGTGSIAPAELTAHGVVTAIKAAARHRLGAEGLNGLGVSILGLGKVGLRLAELLIAEGAKVSGADISQERNAAAQRLGVAVCSVEAAHKKTCDVFAPCALGGILNLETISELNCAVVAGAANNQLQDTALAERLAARRILYAPDYVANSGGLIAVAMQLESESEAWAWSKVKELGDTLSTIFQMADADRSSSCQSAARLAERRIENLTESYRAAA